MSNDVRVAIYRWFREEGRAPMPQELAQECGLSLHDVEAALRQLHDDDVIALAPGTSFIWLAHPFSALDAPFRVQSQGRSWNAICIWDALGIIALLDSDGVVRTTCPDCGDALDVEVREGRIVGHDDYIVHFGVPAARWYEDVGYT
ncbi:MAG: hypothetical protein QOH90_661 [Actinomycetota bacterium]|nr:hypothetical protein [Actinomycetota bacterium]